MGSVYLGFLHLMKAILFVYLLKWSRPVQGAGFCSVSSSVYTITCNNGSVMFIEKLNVFMDSNLKCLEDLRLHCNMLQTCDVPQSCRNLSKETRILYGCVPDNMNEMEQKCSDKVYPRNIQKQMFLVTPSKLNLMKRCLWRLRCPVNGFLTLYVLNANESTSLTFHNIHQELSLAYRAYVFNITATGTIDLSVNPVSQTLLAVKLIPHSIKDISLEDFITCPDIVPEKSYEKFCDSNFGLKISLIVTCFIIIALLFSLCITVYCYCKKCKSSQRSRETSGNRPTSTVIPYQTILINGSKKNNKLNTDNLTSPNHFTKDKHMYDHLDRYDTSYAVRFDPNKPKQDWKRSCDDSDSDSTYATVGENS